MSLINLGVCLLLVAIIYPSEGTVGGYICPSNKAKLLSALKKSVSGGAADIPNIYYAASGHKLLGEAVGANLVKENCALLQKQYKDDATSENIFYALSAWSLLGCSGKIHTENTVKSLRAVLENDKSTVAEIRYAVESLKVLGQSTPNAAKIAQVLQAKLKTDDSLVNLGQALHAASLLESAGKFALDRVEDVVVQADEVDGKLLQWEGGLTTTSLLVTGLLRLPGAKPFTQTQADKVANYLLTRKTVQTPKGIVGLIEAVSALASSSVSPVSITVAGNSFVTVDNPDLKVQITDLLGKSLKQVPAPVVAQSTTRIVDDVVVLSKQILSAGTVPSEFTLPLKLEPGNYRVALSAGSHSTTLNVRVLGPVSINSFEIGVSDTDGSSAPKLTKLQHPSKLSSALHGDSGQMLIAKFALSRQIHQTFLRLHQGSKEVIFIAELDSSKVYKVEVNLQSEISSSGKYNMELILGDAVMSNPMRWDLGTIEVRLDKLEDPEPKVLRSAKPEIRHMFRKAEKRPPTAVSLLFTALTAAPFLLLLGLWLNIGINFGNFTVISIPFHIGFGLILALFLGFWLKLDMFQTCAWLIPLGAFTFFSGHKLLSHIARNKKSDKKD